MSSVFGRVLAYDAQQGVLRFLEAGTPRALEAPPNTLEPGDLFEAHTTEQGSLTGLRLLRRPQRDPFGAGSDRALFAGPARAMLEGRARVLAAVRGFFAQRGYLELDAPTLVTSPGLDLHLHAYAVQTPEGQHFAYLNTSPEYHLKRAVAAGFERCYALARCYRAGELGRKHEPEFTLCEWYRAWAEHDALLEDTAGLVRAAAEVGAEPGYLRVGAARVGVREPFERLTVREAFARHCPEAGDAIELAARDEERFFELLTQRVEPALGHERPCFLSRYPASQASLARLAPEDPSVCERTELYVAGIELSNGFTELTDPAEQRARLERDQAARRAKGLPVYPVDERFLEALERGMPPCVGNALGVERLVMLALGAPSIQSVLAFPWERR